MYYIGLDIGGTKCAAVLGEEIDGKMKILDKIRFDTYPNTPDQILTLFDQFIEKKIDSYDIQGIGISCGGPLNSKLGLILSPPNLPGWDNIKVTSHFQDKWKIKCRLQNDANACAVAEWKFGAGKGYNNIVFLTFGTGLGAGLILDGRLYSGTNDMAGEIGHISISKNGPVGFGKKGSFEGFCSGGGIARLGVLAVEKEIKKGNEPLLYVKADRNYQKITARLIADLANGGDELCKSIYKTCGEKLGEGLSILIDILNPEIIIIGSIYTRSENLLKNHVEKIIKKQAIGYSRDVCIISKAQLDESLGDIAALSVATGKF